MIDQIIANGKEEELYLEFLYEGTVMNSFDMKTAKWTDNKIQFTGILRDIQPSEKVSLDARMYLKNLSDVDQAPYLAHSALNLNMQLTKVNCDTADTPIITSLTSNEHEEGIIHVTMEEGGYELSSYCVDQIERSKGECSNWLSNNDKSFSLDLASSSINSSGTYYLHVKDIRGYIADSTGFDVNYIENTGTSQSFSSLSETVYTVLQSGYYKLEVWGSQGGNNTYGGYGGYSTGIYKATKDEKLYINVGGQGTFQWGGSYCGSSSAAGGYNGGGSSYGCGYNSSSYPTYIGGGGGATHIALDSGLLSTFKNKQDRLLIVAGGGAGGSSGSQNGTIYGGHAGGIEGSVSSGTAYLSTGGTQETPGQSYSASRAADFGLGANSASVGCYSVALGGGGGFYGGGAGYYQKGGSGGSGYVGNPLLLASNEDEKTMFCYSCVESSITDKKTKSVINKNEAATAKAAKIGPGYARITPVSIAEVTTY